MVGSDKCIYFIRQNVPLFREKHVHCKLQHETKGICFPLFSGPFPGRISGETDPLNCNIRTLNSQAVLIPPSQGNRNRWAYIVMNGVMGTLEVYL